MNSLSVTRFPRYVPVFETKGYILHFLDINYIDSRQTTGGCRFTWGHVHVHSTMVAKSGSPAQVLLKSTSLTFVSQKFAFADLRKEW